MVRPPKTSQDYHNDLISDNGSDANILFFDDDDDDEDDVGRRKNYVDDEMQLGESASKLVNEEKMGNENVQHIE